MNYTRKLLLLALAVLGGGVLSTLCFGQGINLQYPDRMVGSLDQCVGLTASQKVTALAVFQRETAALVALSVADRMSPKTDPIRQAAREQLRALLTPEQWFKYERTPQINGGGLTLQSPEIKVARLDQAVRLSSAQMEQARNIFEDELDALLAFPESDRPRLGSDVRQAARAKVRAMLTPEQRQKYEATPQSQGGGKGAP